MQATIMRDCEHLELIDSWEQQNEIIENYIKEKAIAGEVLQILEAGCGQKWDLNLDDIHYVLTGVDLDKAALEIRKNIKKDLHEVIEGDLRSVKLPNNQYDVIYNSFVLEHIDDAGKVLNNFIDWTKPKGLIIICIPDPNSVYGFITRVTPHWFHILCYRLLGDKNAGKVGYGPYPTIYDPVVSRNGIHKFCNSNNLTILAEYGDGFFRPGKHIVRFFIHSVKQVISLLSFGLLSSRHTNLLYIIQKQDVA